MQPSSSTSSSEARGLPGWVALLVALGVALAGEAAVRAGYTPPGELAAKSRDAAARLSPSRPDVAVFGTCIGLQALDHPGLAASLGSTAAVHDITAAGTAPMDWYLAMRNVLDPAALDEVLVLYTNADLSQAAISWQSQAIDMMDTTSVREAAYWYCTDTPCVTELYLRWGSLLYRNRPYLANRVWAAIGARRSGPMDVQAGGRSERATVKTDGPWHFVRRMIELSKERGTPITFVELPMNYAVMNPQVALQTQRARSITREHLAKLGADVVSPTISANGFTDDVHVNGLGRSELTRAVAAVLTAREKR